MNINTKRQVVSLEQTLAYLKYLNREKPFEKEEIHIPEADYEAVRQDSRPNVPHLQQKRYFEEEKSQDFKIKINKNRAIKRIIDSSFVILQKFNTFLNDEQSIDNEKSATVQFNIYLKQFNRVLDLIENKEKQLSNRESEEAQKRENSLQEIYEFTVQQDFRQILPVTILKEKVSKTNIDIMVESLTPSLVQLKPPNQLRVYQLKRSAGKQNTLKDPTNKQSTPVIFKLDNIINVDYHSQPHILMVIAVQKDKQQSNIYIKFDSQQNQDKWDRALYCSHVYRTMKKKDKLFEIEYPEQDVKKKQKDQIKKIAAFSYEVDPNKTLERIYGQKKAQQRTDNTMDASQSSNKDINTSMKKLTVDKKSINTSLNRTLRGNDTPLASNNDTEGKSIKSMFGLLDPQKIIEKGQQEQARAIQDVIDGNSHIYRHLASIVDNQNQTNPNRTDDQNRREEKKPQQQKHEQIMLPQLKEIHDLQRQFAKGIEVQKERFFMNKDKLLYLRENPLVPQSADRQIRPKNPYDSFRQRQLEYWDYDNKTGIKSQRKAIPIDKIKQTLINPKNSSLQISYDTKQIIFIGDLRTLEAVQKWINLISKIYLKRSVDLQHPLTH